MIGTGCVAASIWTCIPAKQRQVVQRRSTDSRPRRRQLPEVALICNFPVAKRRVHTVVPDGHSDDRASMQYSDVVTFFHEFAPDACDSGGQQTWPA